MAFSDFRFTHSEGIGFLCTDKVSKALATAGSDGEARVWSSDDDLNSDEPTDFRLAEVITAFVLKRHSTGSGICTCQGNTAFYGASDAARMRHSIKTCRLADPSSDTDSAMLTTGGAPTLVQRCTMQVTAIDVARNDDIIAAACADFDIKLIRTNGGDFGFKRFSGHKGPVLTVAFDNEDSVLVSSCCDGSIRLWPVPGEESACLASMSSILPVANDLSIDRPLGRFCFSVEHSNLFVPAKQKIVAIEWKSGDKQLIKKTDAASDKVCSQPGDQFSVCSISPTCDCLAAGSVKGVLALFQVGSNSELGSCCAEVCHPDCPDTGWQALLWHPTIENLLVCLDTKCELTSIDVSRLLSSKQSGVTSNKTSAVLSDSEKEDDDFPVVNRGKRKDDGNFDVDDEATRDSLTDLHLIKSQYGFGTSESVECDKPQEKYAVAEGSSRKLESKIGWEPDPPQRPFQVGSTPLGLTQRFLAYNAHGIIRQYETENENSIEIELHNTSVMAPVCLDNTMGYSMGDIGPTAYALAKPNPDADATADRGIMRAVHRIGGEEIGRNDGDAELTETFSNFYDQAILQFHATQALPSPPCRHLLVVHFLSSGDFTPEAKEWRLALADCPVLLCVGASFVCVACHIQEDYGSARVRLFSLGGVQLGVLDVQGPLVTACAWNDRLCVAFNQSAVYDFARKKQANKIAGLVLDDVTCLYGGCRSKNVVLNLGGAGKLCWLGFSKLGKMYSVDDSGNVRLWADWLGSETWIPVLNTRQHCQSSADNKWLFAIDDCGTQGKVRCISVKGASHPPLLPKPIPISMDFQLPLCDAPSEKSTLEASLLASQIRTKCLQTSTDLAHNKEHLLKECNSVSMADTVKLFALAAKADRVQRALDVARLMREPHHVQPLITYAARMHKTALAERLGELARSLAERQRNAAIEHSLAQNERGADFSGTAVAPPESDNVTRPKPTSVLSTRKRRMRDEPAETHTAQNVPFDDTNDSMDTFGQDASVDASFSGAGVGPTSGNPFRRQPTKQSSGALEIFSTAENVARPLTDDNRTAKKAKNDGLKQSQLSASTNSNAAGRNGSSNRTQTPFSMWLDKNRTQLVQQCRNANPGWVESDEGKFFKFAMGEYKQLSKEDKKKWTELARGANVENSEQSQTDTTQSSGMTSLLASYACSEDAQ